jgi:hypothetical protein
VTSGTGNDGANRIDLQRDLRIDLFRGFALLFVFTDHVSEIASAAGLIGARDFPLPTLRIITWTTAAEFFVFLSGYVAGMVYRQTFLARGFWLCQTRPCITPIRLLVRISWSSSSSCFCRVSLELAAGDD